MYAPLALRPLYNIFGKKDMDKGDYDHYDYTKTTPSPSQAQEREIE